MGTQHLSGASPRNFGPMVNYGELHLLVVKDDCYMVATSSSTHSASSDYHFQSGEIPIYHIPRSGSSEYISVATYSGSAVEGWLSIVEYTKDNKKDIG